MKITNLVKLNIKPLKITGHPVKYKTRIYKTRMNHFIWVLAFEIYVHIAAFILWTEMRQQWVGNRPPKKAKQFAEPVLRYIFRVHLVESIHFSRH